MATTEPHEEKAPSTGRRSSPRARISLPAQLETVSARHAVQLTSLSCTGAGAAVNDPLKVGMDVVVKCGPIDAFGVIVWARDGNCGIEFDEPLTSEVVLAARMQSDHQAKFARAEIMADAQAWARGKN